MAPGIHQFFDFGLSSIRNHLRLATGSLKRGFDRVNPVLLIKYQFNNLDLRVRLLFGQQQQLTLIFGKFRADKVLANFR